MDEIGLHALHIVSELSSMKTICLDLTEDQVSLLRAQVDPVFGLPPHMARRIAVDLDTGCWLVSGYGTGKGHAKTSCFGRDRKFHRVAFQCLVGPIPEDHVLDHVRARGCRHRNCAWPEHLEPVTVRENTERGDGAIYQFKPRRAA